MRKTIGAFAVNAAVLAAVLIMYLTLLSPVSVMTWSGSRAHPVYYGGGGASILIPITWDASSLDPILRVLGDNGEHAVFAVTGEWAEACEDTLARIAGEGHELAVTVKSSAGEPGELKEELASALDTVERITGVRPQLLYAPPAFASAASAGNALGLITVAGTLDLDCGRGSAFDIAERLEGLSPGSIITAQPTAGFARALPFLIEKIKNMGIPIVSIHKMLYN